MYVAVILDMTALRCFSTTFWQRVYQIVIVVLLALHLVMIASERQVRSVVVGAKQDQDEKGGYSMKDMDGNATAPGIMLSKPTFDILKVLPEMPPPTVSNATCQVKFRDSSMALCHLIPWGANFGDSLGPAIIKRILEYLYWPCSVEEIPVLDVGTQNFEHPNNTCLFSVGSVLKHVRWNDHIWGTGSHGDDKNCEQSIMGNVTVYATRGPHTASYLLRNCNIKTLLSQSLSSQYGFETMGDPGFLIPFIFPEYKYDSAATPKDYCVIPHYYDKPSRRNIPKENKLNVQQSWQSMVENMLQCNYIVSSSLHGIILADAFGIPSARVWHARVGDFKFQDYYATFTGRSWNESHSVMEALESKRHNIIPQKEREAYALCILSTFPLHLFTTVSTFL